MSMQTLTWNVDAAAVAAVAGNSDAYSLALASQARQKLTKTKRTYYKFVLCDTKPYYFEKLWRVE